MLYGNSILLCAARTQTRSGAVMYVRAAVCAVRGGRVAVCASGASAFSNFISFHPSNRNAVQYMDGKKVFSVKSTSMNAIPNRVDTLRYNFYDYGKISSWLCAHQRTHTHPHSHTQPALLPRAVHLVLIDASAPNAVFRFSFLFFFRPLRIHISMTSIPGAQCKHRPKNEAAAGREKNLRIE